MKVLHVINSLAIGGAERLVADLLPRLKQSGVFVELYVLDSREDAFSHSLKSQGVRVYFAPNNGSNIYSPCRLFELRHFITCERPDILHSHLGPSFHWSALAVSATRANQGKPHLVTTEHATHNRRMRMPLMRLFEKYCYNRYDRIICVSNEVAESIQLWLGLPSDRLPIILNGLELEKFGNGTKPDPELLSWASGRKIVAMTARFIPAKDHRTALQTIKHLTKDYVGVFIGDGPERIAAENFARSIGIADRCFFTGNRNDVPNILSAANLYMQTSVTEGFGLACLEAMASGIPVVASSVGGLKTLVEGAGILFPPGDAKACASALIELSINGVTREHVLDAQAQRIAEYSINVVAGLYRDLYTELME